MTSTATIAAVPVRTAEPAAAPLHLAEGIELIGEFEGSGFREPPHLARRADGQVIQLSPLLYLVAEASDGRRDAGEIAGVVSERFGRTVSEENVRQLADEKLRPLGVLALADGSSPELPKRAPLFALRYRKALCSEATTNAIARCLTWVHRPLAVLLVLGTLAAFDVWLFGIHGIAPALRSAIYHPALLLAALASTVLATAFHELGHASACRYGGARPGVMGAGIYLVWPAFYCDVTDAYRLGRKGRLRTDLGGVYFNGIFALGTAVVYFATGEEAALLAAFLQHMIVLQQLLPLLRFDGYYVLSDLTGVPDILSRIKPIFRSLVHGRKREPEVLALKSWVRWVVTVYLALLLPTLAFMMGSFVVSAPRILATVYDSLGVQLDRIRQAADVAEIGLGAVQMGSLTLPVAAMSLSLGRSSRMLGRGIVTWARGSVPRSIVATVGTLALVGGAAYIWLPNGDYEPIRPGERGTVGEAISSVPDVVGGRPSFTAARAEAFGSVPTEREHEAAERRARSGN